MRKSQECGRRSSMNAVAKIDENVAELEMEAPAQPVANPVAAAPPVAPAPVAPRKERRLGRFLLMVALPAALVIGGAYVWVTGGRYQETENANLQQAKVSIAWIRRAASLRSISPTTSLSSRAMCCSPSIPSPTGSLWPRPMRRSPARGSMSSNCALPTARRWRRRNPTPAKSAMRSRNTTAPPISPARASTPSPRWMRPGTISTRPSSNWLSPSRVSSAPGQHLAAIPISRPTSIRP
ncbi:hypothetical protein MESS2_280043 [Mesorhizobium metallidurans STM 2683]|uniref:Uncharacterized protein n=1 Tax=Mesorhizobium metallidurans STM 2683 TaxID=1297569 RepID=M5F2W7_9HYPH|nr:hypothetical protein MESS2_280043 [Mesorhizobium metallidurans STM 2683]